MIERPSWGRIVASGVLILCANLDRATTGWACAVGAGLIAVWFLLGLGGQANRRWFAPVLAAGLRTSHHQLSCQLRVFGVFFGVSNFDQVWTHVNAYRRKFLAANHNAEEGIIFVPTNLLTYLRPDGISVSNVFPFVTLPTSPPRALGGVLFDRLIGRPVSLRRRRCSSSAEHLGPRDGFPPEGDRKSGPDPASPPCNRECNCCVDAVGLHRPAISG